ncbi:MAG: hypothetical protein HY362_03830 [Candidatus Aenigmarchaeota archaeon]|nr:hypothetical protein [Candidatus Aenigmarchaeota archaeon]
MGIFKKPTPPPESPDMQGARTLYKSILRRAGVLESDVKEYGIPEKDVLAVLSSTVRRVDTRVMGDPGRFKEISREEADAAYNWFMDTFYNPAKSRAGGSSTASPPSSTPDVKGPGYLSPSGASGSDEPVTGVPPITVPSSFGQAPVTTGKPRSWFRGESPYTPIGGVFNIRESGNSIPQSGNADDEVVIVIKPGKTQKPKKEKVTYEFQPGREANAYYGSDGSAILIPKSGAAEYLMKKTDLTKPLKTGRVMRGRFYGSKAQVEAAVNHLIRNSTAIDERAVTTISSLKGKVPMDISKNSPPGYRVIFYGDNNRLERIKEWANKEIDTLDGIKSLANSVKEANKPAKSARRSARRYASDGLYKMGVGAGRMRAGLGYYLSRRKSPIPPPPETPKSPVQSIPLLAPPREPPPYSPSQYDEPVQSPVPPPPPWAYGEGERAGREEPLPASFGQVEEGSRPIQPPPAWRPGPVPFRPRSVPYPPVSFAEPPSAPPLEQEPALEVEPAVVPHKRNGGTPGEINPTDDDPYARWGSI